jgi:molybdopterin molybdotransferase
LNETEVLPTTRVQLANSLGFFIAQPVSAAFDMPSFDNSAVDGYGVRVRDVVGASTKSPVVLNLGGTVRAGDPRSRKLAPGSAVKLFTGAPIPTGVEAVVMREWADESSAVRLRRSAKRGENIRRRSEEFRKGAEVAPEGTRITPAMVGLLAAFGIRSCRVYQKPIVRIITIGDELVSHAKAPSGSRIFDSVGPALLSWCRELGMPDIALQRAGDNQRSLTEAFGKAVNQADVIITVGGVSVGDYDITKLVFNDCGVRRCYWQVAMKPGKPNYFGVLESGRRRKLLVFGLPGNPVAALVSFHCLVKPALLKMMSGRDPVLARFRATLTSPLYKKPGRLEFVRGWATVKEGEWTVAAVGGQESHMLGGLARANCLIHFNAGRMDLPRGSQVVIELLSFS